MPVKRVYPRRVKNVLEYLDKVTVATSEMIIKAADVNLHDIRRMIRDGILTSSLNHNHAWLIPTKLMKKRKDHWGFYQHRIEKYSRTVPIFHIKRYAKHTMSYLASRRPWGLSEKEAHEFTGRSCSKVLNQLVENNAIQVRVLNGEKVYLNRRHKKAEFQLQHRRSNPRFKTDDEDDDDQKVGVIAFEEYCKVFKETLAEMDGLPCVSDDRMAAILLMFNQNRSLRTMEHWIRYNSRIKEATGLPWDLDHTTLSRAFDSVDESFLKKLFHQLVIKLHDKGVITGKFLVVDATHIYAYCNTRKNTDNHPVDGAAWGEHHGSFFGYKVHILIDAESEMPLAMIVSPGNDHDSPYLVPLLKEYEQQYDLEKAIALLADGAYDNQAFRKIVIKKTGGLFLPACNPRRSKILAMMKHKVKRLFEKHGKKINSAQDAFKYLGQRFLTDYNIDLGNASESKLVELIKERLHRPMRAGVERVFSRLKALTSFERPKSQRLGTVKRGLWWCLIGHLVQALTAQMKGLPGSMRKRTMLV